MPATKSLPAAAWSQSGGAEGLVGRSFISGWSGLTEPAAWSPETWQDGLPELES